jgi:Flp pilus assembly protein TadG
MRMASVSRRLGARASRQRGIAAIEFALVFTTLFVVLYGIATFGAVFYTQQVVSRAAEDGARAVPLLSTPVGTNDPSIQSVVYTSLAGSLVVPLASSATLADRRTWIVANVQVHVTSTGSTAVVDVTYPYSANRLLPSLPFLDTSRWMPDNLTSRATAVSPT